MDFAKAFDTVDHKKLFSVIERKGFRGTAYNQVKTYLSDRKQVISVKNAFSHTGIVEYGTESWPQGIGLGPVLFNLYFNDLFQLKTLGEKQFC